MKKLPLLFFVSTLLSAAEALPAEADALPVNNTEAFEQMARFTLAMEQIRQFYVQSGGEISYETLIDGAIEGMMGRLDRYSGYMESREARGMREQTRGSFGGVGVVISVESGHLTIVSPIEDTPGWEAGLLPDDRILEIDGTPTRGFGMEQAVEHLRGAPGSPVKLKIFRPSDRSTFDVTLTRAVIETRSVQRHRLLEPDIAYIRVSSFTETTARMLREELTRAQRRNISGLVLDLRGNPGGLLEAAVEAASLFLPADTLVVYTEGREGEGGARRDYKTVGRRHELELPLAVLVNQGSASASEVVAGALKDHGRARLVGQKTFGKGSVQSVMPLRDGSAIRLTTAIYYSPNGNVIHERGIDPNIQVNFPLRRWSEHQRRASAEDWDWRQDPQLARAVQLLLPPEAETDKAKTD